MQQSNEQKKNVCAWSPQPLRKKLRKKENY